MCLGSEIPNEFEATWKSIMTKFELENNDWLSHMFDIRDMWIPSYFKDIFLAGILRTTSRSESGNSFYGNFLNPNVSLVEFWMRFDSAIEAQRHKKLLADSNSIHSTPKLIMDRGIERHARDVYTRENFYIFQNELWLACVDCGIENKKEQDGIEIFHIYDNGKINSKHREVVYNLSDHNVNCSCKMFQAEETPCKHIFCVLKGKFLKTKGSGKRIKGEKEKSLEQKKKEQGFVKQVVNMLIMIIAIAQKNHLHHYKNHLHSYKKNIMEWNKNKVITDILF